MKKATPKRDESPKRAKKTSPKRAAASRSESPSGEESRIALAWRRLDQALKTFKRPRAATLAPGAGKALLDKFIKTTGLSLPDEVRSYWAVHNGETGADFGLAAGFHFLSVSEAKKSLLDWAGARKILGKDLKSMDRDSRSHPPGAIQKKYSLAGWLPLLWDWEGNHIGVDLDPGPAGTIGQVINFGRDEEDKYVLFPSVVELVEWFASEYAAKRIVFDRTDKVIHHIEGRLTGVLSSRRRGRGRGRERGRTTR